MPRLAVKLSEYRVVHLQICAVEVLGFQPTSQRERNFATITLARCQFAAQLVKFHEEETDEPTAPLLSVLAHAVELLLRPRHLLEVPRHQIEKMNVACMVTKEQITECSHQDWREIRRHEPAPIRK